MKENKLKILIATGIYPPQVGGPATYSKHLADELLKLDCEVKIITYSDDNELDVKSGSTEIKAISRKQGKLKRYWQFYKETKTLAQWADLIYTLDFFSSGLPAVVAGKQSRKPVILRTGGDWLWEKACQAGWTVKPLRDYYKEKKSLHELLLLGYARLILKQFKIIIFSTQWQADLYEKYYRIHRQRIKIVSNALPKHYTQSVEQAKSVILFAGRLIKLKNLTRLIKAFGEIKNDQVELHLYGDGPERSYLEGLIKRLDQTDRIILKGRVDHETLLKRIEQSLFFVLPSLSEVSPNLALECIGLKKPIILTQETGIRSILPEKIKTIDPTNRDDIKKKIEELLNTEALRQYRDYLKTAEINYRSWQEVASEQLAIFKKVL